MFLEDFPGGGPSIKALQDPTLPNLHPEAAIPLKVDQHGLRFLAAAVHPKGHAIPQSDTTGEEWIPGLRNGLFHGVE